MAASSVPPTAAHVLARAQQGLLVYVATFILYPMVSLLDAGVLDLTQDHVQDVLGTNLQELTGEWKAMNARGLDAPTQRLGRVAFHSGRVQAIRYPSKLQPHRANMLLFKDRIGAPLVPARPPVNVSDQDPL